MSATNSNKKTWRVITPVPEDAPEPVCVHYVRGYALRIFGYRDSEGALLGYTCLFGTSSGGSTTLTRTWCEEVGGTKAEWRWAVFPAMRPLFGLDRLAEQPEMPVLVCFDELSATYASEMFPAYVAVSWPGGIRKIGEVDWSPLRGRMVAIWADHGAQTFKVAKGDPQEGVVMPRARQPNWRAAQTIAGTLRAFNAAVWTVVCPREGETFPDGWNIARAVGDGWTAEVLDAWYAGHLDNDRAHPLIKHFPAEPALGGATDVPESAGADDIAPAADHGTKHAKGASTATQAPPVDEELWKRTLLRKDGSGPLLPELANVRAILSHHPAWRDVIYLDEFAQRIMKRHPPPFEGGAGGEWSDTDDLQSHEWLSVQAGILKLQTKTIASAVSTVAKLNGHNPVRTYLRGLQWDGTKRLDTWLRCYLGATPTAFATVADIERLDDYLAVVGRKWMLGAVARAFVPGIKFDYVLIFEGQQGLGKSSAIAILGGDWAMDTPFSMSDKEGMENIRGKWIVELSELDAFNKAETTTAKSFFSRSTDRFRLPYGHRSADFKRSCVFAGTTNEHEYFRDATGNRRYWPVVCRRQGFDRDALKRDRDQLFAEALAAFDAGEQIYPDLATELNIIRPEQDLRSVPDTWIGKIADWLANSEYRAMNPHEKITVRMLLEQCIKIDAGRIDQHSHAIRVGRALNKLGYRKVEDKSLPDRFYYEKRQSNDQDAE